MKTASQQNCYSLAKLSKDPRDWSKSLQARGKCLFNEICSPSVRRERGWATTLGTASRTASAANFHLPQILMLKAEALVTGKHWWTLFSTVPYCKRTVLSRWQQLGRSWTPVPISYSTGEIWRRQQEKSAVLLRTKTLSFEHLVVSEHQWIPTSLGLNAEDSS